MQNKKLLLIVNPCSGRAKMYTELLKVVEIFSYADFVVSVYPTKCKGDATEYAKKLTKDDFDLIVVCGGDGTLNEVIEGIMTSGSDIPLGYIPSGTLNEWSSGLNISRNIETAAKDIINGKKNKLDIGKFNDKYFSYTASPIYASTSDDICFISLSFITFINSFYSNVINPIFPVLKSSNIIFATFV